MASKDPVLQPFQLKHLTLRNRIMSTAHAPNYVSGGHPGERYYRYNEEKAKGGLALIIFGGSSNVSIDSPSIWGQIDLGADSIVPHLTELADRIHRHGAAAMCQVTHMGRRTVSHDGDWLPVIGPSHRRERLHRAFPKAMERQDIDRVTADFAGAAQRCQEAGVDGIELLAFGHLLGQFMSPAVNTRDDEYGGSLENRLRFPLAVLGAVREVVGNDFVVGMRIAGDEESEAGMGLENCIEAACLLAGSGRVDFLNVTVGMPDTEAGIEKWMPGMGFGTAPHIETVGRIRASVDLPVFHAGAITDLPTARHVLREGLADMVGMTRAHLADPYLVKKAARGEEDFIRPCVGIGFCVDRVSAGLDAACAHNVVTGRETEFQNEITPSPAPGKRIVIVGGGPGGMEAARVCRLRGHDVVLLEAGDRLGGQVNLAGMPRLRRQMHSIADWLRVDLERLEVAIHYNVYAEAEEVLAEAPDVVIIATGGIPNTEVLPRDNEMLLSVWDVLSGEVKLSGDVLLYDDHGNHQGISCADFLADQGVNVEIVTPDRAIGHEVGIANRPSYMRHLYAKGTRMTPDTTLERVERDGNRLKVSLKNDYSGEVQTRVVDHVVVEHGVVPNEELYFQLIDGAKNRGHLDLEALRRNQPQIVTLNREGNYVLFRVGDAVSSRDVHSAMLDAHRLCRLI